LSLVCWRQSAHQGALRATRRTVHRPTQGVDTVLVARASIWIAIEGQRQLVRIKRVRVPCVPEALLVQSFMGVAVVATRRPWKPVGVNAESYEPSGMGSAEHKYNFLQIRPDQSRLGRISAAVVVTSAGTRMPYSQNHRGHFSGCRCFLPLRGSQAWL